MTFATVSEGTYEPQNKVGILVCCRNSEIVSAANRGLMRDHPGCNTIELRHRLRIATVEQPATVWCRKG